MTALAFDNKAIETFRLRLEQAKRVAIIAHCNPDGDCVGSLLGLREVLSHHLHKEATALLPDPCPDAFGSLQGVDAIIDAVHDRAAAEATLRDADLILCVDLNEASRTGCLQTALQEATAFKIVIDHHHTPDHDQFPLVFSIPDLSSTCEMLYWIILQTWGAEALDTAAARCLYFGLCTDTGSFSYACEDSSLYAAAAGLVQFPIGAAEIHNEIDNTFSTRRMRLLGFLLSERLRIFEEQRFAYFYVSLEDQQRFGTQAGDMEGFVNYTLMLKEIEVGLMMRETEGGDIRLSLRSKYDFDVNLFARRQFGGGGHAKAAGATLHGDFATAVAEVENLFLSALKK